MVVSSRIKLNGALIRNPRKPELSAALVGYPKALGGTNLTAPVLRKIVRSTSQRAGG